MLTFSPRIALHAALASCLWAATALARQQETKPVAAELAVLGVTVTPHVRAPGMVVAKAGDKALGARVELFVRAVAPANAVVPLGADRKITFNGKTPDQLVADGSFAWHDLPSAWTGQPAVLDPGELGVFAFNTKTAAFGPGMKMEVVFGEGQAPVSVALPVPQVWISAVDFTSGGSDPRADTLIIHIANESPKEQRIAACNIWLPESAQTFRAFKRQAEFAFQRPFPADGKIPPHDRGGMHIACGKSPSTPCVIEVTLESEGGGSTHVWARQRMRKTTFDIGAGWIAADVKGKKAMTYEPWLQTLKALHVNTARLSTIPGYTDQDGEGGFYKKYPLRYFDNLPAATYDTDALLPRIHATDPFGDAQSPQGKPMDVLKKLAPYAPTRLSTTMTVHDESTMRYYAGLADVPNLAAYRVSAPSADNWRAYDRWGAGKRLGWGAPLETLGEMTRAWREMSRPGPIAGWAQAAHDGFSSLDGRLRCAPTPDEMRVQAYELLANRVTSLHWHSLGIKGVVKYRDLITEVMRLNVEARVIGDLLVQGDGFRAERKMRDGKPDWDLASVVSEDAAALFAIDVDYQPDTKDKVFKFGPPRDVVLHFELPCYLRKAGDVFRVDADGTYDVVHKLTSSGVEITDKISKTGLYIAAADKMSRYSMDERRNRIVMAETQIGFDPGSSDEDYKTLKDFVEKR
jgi:hypothetical protein